MSDEQQRARFWGFVFTFVYLACFFLSFYSFVFVPELLGNPQMTTSIGLTLIFLSLLTPLSIVVGIGAIWNRYLNNDYHGLYLASLIPIATFIIVIIISKIIQLLFL